MNRLLCLIFVSSCLIGCASTQLRMDTLRLTSTVPDIQAVQVLDNLARLTADPGVMPYYTIITNGTANVSDKAKVSGFLTFPAQTIVKQLHNQRGGQLGPLSGERDITGNWSLKPVNDPYRLAAMRCACQIALGMTDQIKPDEFDRLRVYLRKNYKNYNGNPMNVIPSGFTDHGTKWEVPKHWPYVANCGHEYVWVKPDRLRDFTSFALIYLDIATLTAGPKRDLPDAVKKPQTGRERDADQMLRDYEFASKELLKVDKVIADAKDKQIEMLTIEKNLCEEKVDDLKAPLKKRLSEIRPQLAQAETDRANAERIRPGLLEDVRRKFVDMMQEQRKQVLEAEAFDAAIQAAQCQEQNEMPSRTDDVQTINPGLFFIPR
jgi:hypothetical protein